jgi:hypothetical protein
MCIHGVGPKEVERIQQHPQKIRLIFDLSRNFAPAFFGFKKKRSGRPCYVFRLGRLFQNLRRTSCGMPGLAGIRRVNPLIELGGVSTGK